MAKISVIVPVYNVEDYLDRCIKSIINQTLDDIEIILINDGSNDRSGTICEQYANIDRRIKVVHKENQGVSVARNIGIEIANGKYIQFVDSDDWIEERLCEDAYNLIESEKSDIVFWGIKVEDEEGNFIRNKKSTIDIIKNLNIDVNMDAINLYNIDLYGYTCCKLFKSKIIKNNKIRFDEDMDFCEDEEFTCKYYKFVDKVSILQNSQYHYITYTKNRKTLSSTPEKNKLLIRDRVFKSWFNLLGDNKYKKFLLNKSYNNFYYILCDIIWGNDSIINKKSRLKKLSNTSMYNYLIKNSGLDIKILLYIVKYRSILFIKIYNRLLLIKKRLANL